MKGTTKDELFLLKLHELAIKMGGEEEEVDKMAVGKAIGVNDRGIVNIVRHLAQANFIKKGNEEGAVKLTPHGLKLVENLLEERRG